MFQLIHKPHCRRRIKRWNGENNVVQNFHIDAAESQHDQRSELFVLYHPKYHLDTGSVDFGCHYDTRSKTLCEIMIGAYQHFLVGNIKIYAMLFSFVNDTLLSRFQYHRITQLLGRLDGTGFTFPDLCRIDRQAETSQQHGSVRFVYFLAACQAYAGLFERGLIHRVFTYGLPFAKVAVI